MERGTGMSNSTQLARQLLHHNSKQFLLPRSISPAAMPGEGIFPFGVRSELTLLCWQTEAPQRRETGLYKGGADHRLAAVGTTQQLSITFSLYPPPPHTKELFNRAEAQHYLYTFQTKVSDHHLPTHL